MVYVEECAIGGWVVSSALVTTPAAARMVVIFFMPCITERPLAVSYTEQIVRNRFAPE